MLANATNVLTVISSSVEHAKCSCGDKGKHNHSMKVRVLSNVVSAIKKLLKR
jgi:hypothetical protein